MFAPTHTIAFHGCDEAVGEAVLSGHEIVKPSQNDYDWLGHGAYFWEDDRHRAEEWAEWMMRVGKCKSPFVLGAVIRLGFCLDLTRKSCVNEVTAAYHSLEAVLRVRGRAMPENRKARAGDNDLVMRDRDCAVLNHLHDIRKEGGMQEYETVRSPFMEGTEAFPGARLQAKTHVQLCVRNLECIEGYFRLPNTKQRVFYSRQG